MSMKGIRTKEEIRDLKRKDPFFAFRGMKKELTDEELYTIFSLLGLDEWEKQNMDMYMVDKILLEDE
ncbi:hypothetical protein UFOVP53_163 [uncultured Caudovirales phage]|uniref:Uncharacterized protein n=1 Tax=uncultured Caudovirales phage TaxID=2100421 RepID=A0A6J5KSS0_9CAUD|nr:hypothetical protein UFOVP53_163 [uncultured Caudovirales phage]